jgi:ammonia channel protein AmtB
MPGLRVASHCPSQDSGANCKRLHGADDWLDVIGIHAVGGIPGALTERVIADELRTRILAWREEGKQGPSPVLAAGSPRTTGCAWGLTIGKVE